MEAKKERQKHLRCCYNCAMVFETASRTRKYCSILCRLDKGRKKQNKYFIIFCRRGRQTSTLKGKIRKFFSTLWQKLTQGK